MEIEVDEDLYPLVKESATSLCFQKMDETLKTYGQKWFKNLPRCSYLTK